MSFEEKICRCKIEVPRARVVGSNEDAYLAFFVVVTVDYYINSPKTKKIILQKGRESIGGEHIPIFTFATEGVWRRPCDFQVLDGIIDDKNEELDDAVDGHSDIVWLWANLIPFQDLGKDALLHQSNIPDEDFLRDFRQRMEDELNAAVVCHPECPCAFDLPFMRAFYGMPKTLPQNPPSSNSDIASQGEDEDENIAPAMMPTSKQFQLAVDRVKNAPKTSSSSPPPPRDVLLKLYALYKQVTEGDNTTPEPSMFNVVAKTKWKAADLALKLL